MSSTFIETLNSEKDVKEITRKDEHVYCPRVFNNIYDYFDAILNKHLWHDESNTGASNSQYFSKAERLNIFFYITGIMCYKVSAYCPSIHPEGTNIHCSLLITHTLHELEY